MIPTNLTHVLNMVLFDNRDQKLTEALILGIERSVMHYLTHVESSEQKAVMENENGTQTQ